MRTYRMRTYRMRTSRRPSRSSASGVGKVRSSHVRSAVRTCTMYHHTRCACLIAYGAELVHPIMNARTYVGSTWADAYAYGAGAYAYGGSLCGLACACPCACACKCTCACACMHTCICIWWEATRHCGREATLTYYLLTFTSSLAYSLPSLLAYSLTSLLALPSLVAYSLPSFLALPSFLPSFVLPSFLPSFIPCLLAYLVT